MTVTPRLAVLPLLSIALLSIALAACKGEEKPAQKGTVAGRILPGSASDAMLPYDTTRSQPPLAPQTGTSSLPGDARAPRAQGSGAAEEAQAAPADGAPAAAAAAAPTIAAEPVE
jgi:hypothetical protein